jgi:hypothetical protein
MICCYLECCKSYNCFSYKCSNDFKYSMFNEFKNTTKILINLMNIDNNDCSCCDCFNCVYMLFVCPFVLTFDIISCPFRCVSEFCNYNNCQKVISIQPSKEENKNKKGNEINNKFNNKVNNIIIIDIPPNYEDFYNGLSGFESNLPPPSYNE